MPDHLMFLSGQRTPGDPRPLLAPGTAPPSTPLGNIHYASAQQIDQAVAAMVAVFPELRRQTRYQRYETCATVHRLLIARQEDFARTIALEAGKPIKTARGEVARAITTFRLAAEEATRFAGEQLPVDIDARSQGYSAIIERVPIGPCSFITPFNFPLNLVAHKVAPALAAGCPFVVKPSERTPLTALLLGELLAETKLPPGSWHILPADRTPASALITDDRINLLSFTGSPDVGWKMKAAAGRKTVILELGNNSAVIVEPDTNLADAIPRIVTAAFGYAGQSCISVQRIFLHDAIADEATRLLIAQTKALKRGDVLDESTDIGPMIDEPAAIRLEEWIAEAVQSGADALVGGPRHGSYYPPTLLEYPGVARQKGAMAVSNGHADAPPPTFRLACKEAFGPVALIERYRDFPDALVRVNATDYGLQAGVFTGDLAKARLAFDTLQVAAIIINDVPTLRIDAMPYGGLAGKNSGLGREGPKYAMEHMTERKLLVARLT